MINLLSIILPYYNRRGLLFTTLDWMAYYQGEHSIETIIVDDGSNAENSIQDVVDLYPTLNINLIVLPQSKWRTPTDSYNTGFNAVTGDTIMINSSECVHTGDVIGYVFDQFQPNDYMVFAAYMGDEYTSPIVVNDKTKYGVHSSIGNFIPYCAVISRANMEQLSGYDERFSKGVGFDDYDFQDRVYNLGLNMSVVDHPFVFHQWHPPTNYINTINKDLLFKLREDAPKRIKAIGNKIYNK